MAVADAAQYMVCEVHSPEGGGVKQHVPAMCVQVDLTDTELYRDVLRHCVSPCKCACPNPSVSSGP